MLPLSVVIVTRYKALPKEAIFIVVTFWLVIALLSINLPLISLNSTIVIAAVGDAIVTTSPAGFGYKETLDANAS